MSKQPRKVTTAIGTQSALSDAELDHLATFLEQLSTDDSSMSLSMVDGLFSALAVSPKQVSTNEWLSWVIGDFSQLPNPDMAQPMLSLLMRHYEQIQQNLRNENPPCFDPIYLYREDSETPWVADWCHGFMGGVNIRASDWEQALHQESDMLLLELLVGMSTLPPPDESMPTFETLVSEEEKIFMEAQVFALASLEDYRQHIDPLANWDNLVEVTVLSLRDHVLHPPLLDNVCPCGSGKAFEACCGAGDRLLH